MKYLIVVIFFFYGNFCFAQTGTKQNIERGKATYYAEKFQNRKTASGVLYKKENLVCAHRKYPFGTKLLVRNLSNNKEVVVEVIDRGPFRKGRIIDLSYAAAKEIDMIRQGIVEVEIFEYYDLPSKK